MSRKVQAVRGTHHEGHPFSLPNPKRGRYAVPAPTTQLAPDGRCWWAAASREGFTGLAEQVAVPIKTDSAMAGVSVQTWVKHNGIGHE